MPQHFTGSRPQFANDRRCVRRSLSSPRRCPSWPRPSFETTSRSSDIAAGDWNALAPGSPFLAHAFLTALHRPGCATPRDRLDAALPDRLGRRTPRRRDAAVREDPQLRRIRLRLGLGRSLSPSRPPLLPEARRARCRSRRCPGRACSPGTRAVRRAHARARAGRSCRRHEFSSLHVLFLPDDEAREGEALGMIPRAGRAVPLDQRRLSRLRRFPADVLARQAQEDEAGAAQARARPA